MAEKTEEPTQRRLTDARKRGEVVFSRDVSSTLCFVGLIALLWTAGTFMFGLIHALWNQAMHAISFAEPLRPISFTMLAAETAAFAVLPVVGLLVVLGIAGSFFQVGALMAFTRLKPDAKRLNPAEGLKRIFAMRNVVELLKMLLKTSLLGALMYMTITSFLQTALNSGYASPAGILQLIVTILLAVFGWACVIYLVMSGVDYAHQRFEFMKQQRMSKEDVRREHKDTEGSPETMGRRKSIHQEAIYAGLADWVRVSSVVIHSKRVAVALMYQGERDLPRVVARGEGAVATHLRELAVKLHTPAQADAELAQRLYDKIPLGQPITRAFYESVAALLHGGGSAL